MGKLKFYSVGYWDKTMDIHEDATEANKNKVIDFAQNLNAKYAHVQGCERHPDIEHFVQVYFSNGYKDLQLEKNEDCKCADTRHRFNEILVHEIMLNNPQSFANPPME